MLEPGEVKSLKEIAAREGIDNSYVSRMVNLIRLAPDIAEAILDDNLPSELTLFDIAVDPPALWVEQTGRFLDLRIPDIHVHIPKMLCVPWMHSRFSEANGQPRFIVRSLSSYAPVTSDSDDPMFHF